MPSDKTPAKPSAKTRPYQSSIPRPKTRFNPPSFQSKASTDDSDLENRYERYSRDKRKLTVANAEVLPSGSSSESEVESGRVWDTGVVQNNQRAVGLGLDMSVEVGRNDVGRRWEEVEIPDRQSNRESARQKILRFSLPPSESAGSRYSESSEAAFRQSHGDQADLAADHERRRAALMSIVSGLDAEMVNSTPKMSESQEGGEYFVEQGFAYSGSQDMSFAAASPSRVEKGKDRDEDGRGRNQQGEKRPRSSSCAPALWVSAEEPMTEVPPRSQSVCQWNAISPSQSSYRGGLEAEPVDEVKRHSSSIRSSTLSIPRRLSAADGTGPSLEVGYMDVGKRQSSPIRPSIPPIPRPSTFEDKDVVRHPHRWGVYDDERLRKQQLSSPLTSTDHSFHSSAGNSSYSVAARERLAFGIPPSESDEVHLIPDVLSQTDSSLSLLEGGHWQEEWDTLSSGAESLLRQLSFESTVGYQRRSRQVRFLVWFFRS